MKVGDKVLLKKSYAKWHLDNPDMYEIPSLGTVDENYETETLLHLMCCMGIPIQGCITDMHRWVPPYGTTYHVAFRVGKLKMSYWVERRHIEKVSS